MALDDAIGKARRERDRLDEQARLKEKWEEEARERVEKLAAEAVTRLAPYAGRESLHLYRPVRGPQNRTTYRQAGSWWCWRIRELDGTSVINPRVMLLVLDPDRTTGHFAAVTLNRPRTDKGQYVTMAADPVGPVHYSKEHPMAFFGSEWVNYLEQDVADAIVRYEREG
ncbi:hypothetical protein ACIRO1_45195 [Streptomyces sp. NPDC102381]|uniref:hypothetical protein n=1 Tax=Streptomyces sp. NPDC102381 TaxID=3366164 RepID=UPI0038224CE2